MFQGCNFLIEGVSCGLDKEIALDGTYLKYFPFRAMIERSQITPYHKKLEGVADTKIQRHILPLEVVYPPLALRHTGVVELQA